ncbi:hypothetical protein [Sphingomonas astaxanthinifaciens]|uniref:Uncharacterized protein n=1 Tax=Sphingomonas astaxanthinifaciens DSM 22298 TaxID=1123267 RepID=A0ABQ5Z8B6_9SPHN|nr:hypothetical protein [Sphingomonas astaxanthinifaciens]GLR48240.1 hypothetical protein GCM10007925_19530 [Sphingomonas astaxanthinifaciens DSM 22298]
MTALIGIVLGGIACLALIALRAHDAAAKADASGELRFHVRGLFGEQTILRSDDPVRFAHELMLLRAVPWLAAGLTAFGMLLVGIAQ